MVLSAGVPTAAALGSRCGGVAVRRHGQTRAAAAPVSMRLQWQLLLLCAVLPWNPSPWRDGSSYGASHGSGPLLAAACSPPRNWQPMSTEQRTELAGIVVLARINATRCVQLRPRPCATAMVH